MNLKPNSLYRLYKEGKLDITKEEMNALYKWYQGFSGIIFILISWLVSGFPLWLSITLTIWGVLKILFAFIKIDIKFSK